MTDTQTIAAFITSKLLDGADEPIGAEDHLLQQGLVDSLGVVQLVEFLEQEFGVEIKPGDVTLKHFKTLNSIVALIDAKRAAG